MHLHLVRCWPVKPESLIKGFFMSKRRKTIEKFYMVRLEGGQWPPTVKHKTLGDAIQEATRLSKEFGQPATVLASIVKVETKGDVANLIDVNPDS
jgi:hypothetical protein